MDVFNLKGKVALITGASKGIGEAVAQGLAMAGAHVIVSSRDQAAVDAVAETIRARGGSASAKACNVGDDEALAALVAFAEQEAGGVDILINNAATNPVYGPVIQTDTRAFDKIMNINVKAPFELAKRVHPSMKARGGGSIINISSIGGLSPEPGLGIYSVSKAALNSLTKVMAKEWGSDGIRVNVLCPGLIQTKFSEALWHDDKLLARFLKMTPLGRMGQPEDLIGMTLLLASDAGAYCTGGVYTIDGGVTG